MAKQPIKRQTQKRGQEGMGKSAGRDRQKVAHSWLPVSAVAVFAVATPYLTGTNDLLLSTSFLVAILSVAVVASVLSVWRRTPLSFSVPEIALLAFVIWQWLTVATSVYRWASLLEASKWTAFAIVTVVVRHLCDERRTLWLSAAFVGAAALTALQGVREYVASAVAGSIGWRVFGPFLQPNLFGNFLLVAFFVALGIIFQRPQGWVLLPAFTALLLFATMVLTGSKGALLAWAAGLIAFGVMVVTNSTLRPVRRRVLFSLAIVGTVLVGVVALVPTIRPRFETLWTAQVHSWMFRLFVWEASLVGALARPILGFGAGTFEWAYPQFTAVGFTRHAHDGFLQVAIESGFVGLALLLAFFSALLFSKPADSPIYPFARSPVRWGCVAAIIAFCLHNLVETAWMTVANLMALAIVCGINASTLPTRWQLQRHCQIALMFPLAIGLWHSVAVVRGAYFVKQAQNERLPSSRLYWLGRASDADPLNARHRIDRAILLEAWAQATGDKVRLKEASRLCEEAIGLQPTRAGNYKVKARILWELGELGKAERALRMALKFNRTDTEALLRLGELLEDRGKINEAVQIYRRLVVMEKSPYGRYKPVDQWQDIFIAAGKIRLAKHSKPKEAQRLLSEAQGTLQNFLDAYLPILRAGEPEVAATQEAFVRSLLDSIRSLQEGRKGAPQNLGR